MWLWGAQSFKTRSSATKAVTEGHVWLDGDPIKLAYTVRPGDRVTAREPGWAREFEVVGLLNKRVGTSIAWKAYVDRSPERPTFLSVPVTRHDRGVDRPTKKDRGTINRLMGLGD